MAEFQAVRGRLEQTRRAGCIWFFGLAVIVLVLAWEIRALKTRIKVLESRAVATEGR